MPRRKSTVAEIPTTIVPPNIEGIELPPPRKKLPTSRILMGAAVLIFLISGGTYLHVTKVSSAVDEREKVINKASRLMMLPTDEVPVLASVSDIEVLKKFQPFFSNAQNGDQVLIYQNNRKAVIYSPKSDKIVNAGPIYSDSTTTPSI